jgi:hypothetical protein
MTIKHARAGSWLDWRRCYTGAPPSSAGTGSPAQRIWSWMSQWKHGDMIATYSGRPTPSINGAGNCDFYIICCAPDKTDGTDVTRTLGIALSLWRNDDYMAFGGPHAEWCAPYDTVSPQVILDLDDCPFTGDAVAGDYPAINYFFAYDTSEVPLTYEPENAADDGCRLCKISLDYAVPATLGVWHLPQAELSATQMQVCAPDVAAGQIISGADGAILGSSLGALLQLVGAGANDTESMERCGRRTLFQTPYPVGVYQTDSAGYAAHRQDSDGNAFMYRVRSRNLLGASSGVAKALPAMVLTADAGVRVRFRSITAADSWVYTVPAGGIVNCLVTASDGDGANHDLDIDNDAAELITIETDTTGRLECLLQTVALFEAAEW